MSDEQAAPWPKPLWLALGAASIAFHLWLIFSGLVPNLISRPLHMALAVPWIMFVFKGGLISRGLGWALGAGGIAVCIWLATTHRALDDQYGALQGNVQIAAALLVLACVIEMARRAIGWPLPLIAVLALVYGLYGQHIPGELGHPGLPVESFLGTLVIAEGGLWGQLTGVSVSVVAVFVIFGAVLNAGEAGQGFMNLALASAGRLKAGAAKVSVLASSLFGSISGSASANVASTGSFTLPAMKRLGYPPSFAAAVEAVASSGGQIMPPLMGAGAFVMVELTSTPYTAIMAAAALPALLFFVAVWFGVDGFANRYDLKGMGDEARIPARTLVVTGLFFLVPFAVLMERLFVGGYTAQYAAALAILTAAVLLLFNSSGVAPVQQITQRFSSAIITTGQQIAMIAAIILCASIIVGVLGQTGLGVKITSLIVDLSGGWLPAALLLTALACLILGMEVPTTAAYVICISVAGPALQQLGVPLLAAHLFVFWFALLSTITPPVCGTVFIAAGMAGAPWLRVAVHAMLLGVGLYLIPLAMMADLSLIALGESPALALAAFLRIGAGLYLVSSGLISRSRGTPIRTLMVCAGVLLLFLPALFDSWPSA
ncbi:MAG: TRAP transporter fused permease subunit [Anderseniella sp.]|nr:TRAP transporter fused permease subunit [Anderseniella sp.]